MKNKSNTYWLISALFLASAALWSAFSQLSEVMSTGTICGIALIVFGVISMLAAFTLGIRSAGSGWIMVEGLLSFFCGLSYIFSYVDYSLFTVDLVYIMGLWLMFLGISQIIRSNKKSRSFSSVVVMITGVLAVFCGLALYVRPVADLLQLSAGGALQVYSTTFQFMIAAILVVSRLLLKGSRK